MSAEKRFVAARAMLLDSLSTLDNAPALVETLLDAHRDFIAERLDDEANRYIKGAFVDGIKHSASILVCRPGRPFLEVTA